MPLEEYFEIKKKLGNWRELIKPYAFPNDKKAYVQLLNTFLPFFLICTCMYFSNKIWINILLGIIGGLFMVRIFIIQHDCGHQSFLSSRKKNNAVGFLCSLFTLIPFKYWARSHNHHHAHNAQLEMRDIGDISLLTVKEYQSLSPFKRFQYRIYRSSLVMFLLGPLYYIFIHNRLPLIRLKGWRKEKRSLWISNLFLILFYSSLIYMMGIKKLISIELPIIITFSITAIWVFYIQHQHDPNYKAWKKDWDFLIASIKGSSYYKLPSIGHWFTGNIGYHHIHHLAPKVPFYHLSKCHHANPLFEKYVTTLNFWDSFKCAFYKLWDEESQKMITFKAYYKIYEKGIKA